MTDNATPPANEDPDDGSPTKGSPKKGAPKNGAPKKESHSGERLKTPELGIESVKVMERSTVYRRFFTMDLLKLRHKLFGGGWSEEINRELFIRGDAVAAILYDNRNDLIALVDQFRVGALQEALGPWCLEVVAGMIEAGETPEDVVKREVKEEANVQVEKLEFICRYLSSPGGCDESVYLYCALCDLSNAGGIHGVDHEHEDIQVCVFKAQEVFQSMYRGRCNTAAILIALQWLQLNRNRLRNLN